MGPKFSTPVIRNFLILIMVDLIVISACIFPVVPVNSTEVLFEVKDSDINRGDIVYRWFEAGKGQEIHIDYWCDGDVEAYLLTRSQFTEYSSESQTESLNAVQLSPTGKVHKTLDDSGVHFFMLKNPNNEKVNIIYSQCIGSTIERVTIIQKVREYVFQSGLISEPSMHMVRDNPGVGSFA